METLKTDGLVLRSGSSDKVFWDAAHAVNFETHSLWHWRFGAQDLSGHGDKATLFKIHFILFSTTYVLVK